MNAYDQYYLVSAPNEVHLYFAKWRSLSCGEGYFELFYVTNTLHIFLCGYDTLTELENAITPNGSEIVDIEAV